MSDKKEIRIDIYQAQDLHRASHKKYYEIVEKYVRNPRESTMQQLDQLHKTLCEIERVFPALADDHRQILHTSLIA